ncbi:MAG: DUF4328 domain-containing protein [Polyangiaceae bacterium]
MAYHTATKPSPRYPEHYVSQGKLVTSLSVALGIYTVLSLCLFAAQVWSALVASDVVKLTDDTAEVMFVTGSTIHFLRDGFDAACCAAGVTFIHRASHNARVLGAFAMRFTPESSVEAFNGRDLFGLLLPPRLLSELWAASGPENEALRPSRMVTWWWPLFVASKAIQVWSLLGGFSRDPAVAWCVACSQLLDIGVLYLSYRLLEGLHERQELRAIARAASKHRAQSA